MPFAPPLWSVLFFIMIILLGLDSQVRPHEDETVDIVSLYCQVEFANNCPRLFFNLNVKFCKTRKSSCVNARGITRKRHTAYRVASTCYAVPVGGTPCPLSPPPLPSFGKGVPLTLTLPPTWTWEGVLPCPHPLPGPGKGVPLPLVWTWWVPCPLYPPPGPGKGVPPAWTWEGGTPPPPTWIWEEGTLAPCTPHLDLGRGYSPISQMVVPPPPPPMVVVDKVKTLPSVILRMRAVMINALQFYDRVFVLCRSYFVIISVMLFSVV